jgi:hypothetical protein
VRFAFAALAVLALLGPVIWAALSKRGQVANCCAPADPRHDARMESAFRDNVTGPDSDGISTPPHQKLDRQS